MSNKEYDFPAYTTQGGGIAKFREGHQLIWEEPPEQFPEMYKGGLVPMEWDYQPINQLARERDQYVESGDEGFFALIEDELNNPQEVIQPEPYPDPEELSFYLRCEDELALPEYNQRQDEQE